MRTTHPDRLSACVECDCLQRIPALEDGAAAHCSRCGAELFRFQAASLDRTLAFLLASAVVFVILNAAVLLEFDKSGLHRETTLFGTAVALRDHGMSGLGVLVLATAQFMPALELALLISLLLPLRLGFVPPWLAPAFRLIAVVRPWVMLDVFLLATIVTLSRLSQMAEAYTGPALFALGGYVILRALAMQAYEPDEVWRRVAELDGHTTSYGIAQAAKR
jgi:paraquat-inducible protein A